MTKFLHAEGYNVPAPPKVAESDADSPPPDTVPDISVQLQFLYRRAEYGEQMRVSGLEGGEELGHLALGFFQFWVTRDWNEMDHTRIAFPNVFNVVKQVAHNDKKKNFAIEHPQVCSYQVQVCLVVWCSFATSCVCTCR